MQKTFKILKILGSTYLALNLFIFIQACSEEKKETDELQNTPRRKARPKPPQATSSDENKNNSDSTTKGAVEAVTQTLQCEDGKFLDESICKTCPAGSSPESTSESDCTLKSIPVGQIQTIVNQYLDSKTKADIENKYGEIKHWDTSNVKDISMLFKYKTSFNKDIGALDTSQVTNMNAMFTKIILNTFL